MSWYQDDSMCRCQGWVSWENNISATKRIEFYRFATKQPHSCSLSDLFCYSRSFWLTPAHSGSLWLSRSLSGAHRLTMSLLGSLSHCPSLSCPDMMSSRRKGACKMLTFCFFLWLCSNKQFHRAVVRIGKQGRDWRTCKQAISPLTIPLGTSTCSANYNIH